MLSDEDALKRELRRDARGLWQWTFAQVIGRVVPGTAAVQATDGRPASPGTPGLPTVIGTPGRAASTADAAAPAVVQTAQVNPGSGTAATGGHDVIPAVPFKVYTVAEAEAVADQAVAAWATRFWPYGEAL